MMPEKAGVVVKMAARWGAGEETLSACNMDFFSTNVLGEQAVILPGGLSSECMAGLDLDPDETLGVLHSCMDPSILSIFEDTPTENKSGIDEESEATLLTALTEILDNVDDENLSPFDMLPESDLLSGQKGREHSPLRRLLCLSRSPPEKEMYCNTRHFSTGKSLPSSHASVQRSDGEEEEDGEAYSLSLGTNSQPSSPEQGLLSWGDLPLPLSLEQNMETEFEDGESLSVSLGELVKHMHPYCMSVCLENGEEEMLPEEGILLEVVNQGEDGETIFAIRDIGMSISQPTLPLPEEEVSCRTGPRVSADISNAVVLEDSDDDIVVDDELTVVAGSADTLRGERDVGRRPKEMLERCSSRKKKKRKNRKEMSSSANIALETAQSDRRVLRSSTNKRATPEPTTLKPVKEMTKPERNGNELFTSAIATVNTSNPKMKAPRPAKMEYVQRRTQVSTLTLPSHPSVKVVPASHNVLNVRSPGVVPKNVNTTPEKVSQLTLACEKPQGPPASTANPLAPQTHAALKETLFPTLKPTQHPNPREAPASSFPEPTEVSPPVEAKPKPLSLEQYRLLRQQKKPTPVRQMEDQSTKWPSLPEAPTELLPIPCLPAPSPRDPRRTQHSLGKNVVVEVKDAWQPMGPGAPPTPEALLVPPAYMKASKTSSTSKVVDATPTAPPQQANVPAEASQSPAPMTSVPASTPVKLVPQTSSVKFSNVCSVPPGPLPQSMYPSLKNVDLNSFQNMKGMSSKTTTDAHRPTQIAAILPPKHTPIAAAVLEGMLTPTAVAAVSVQKPTQSAILKGAATLQKAVSVLPQHHMSAVTAAPAPTQPSKPLLRCTPTHKALKAKSPTQELIESFTSEIGIEAADLTSLLEQFEETQAKEDQCVPEVSGRVAAVGNSSVQPPCDRTAVERVKAHDLTSTAGLTPPATPPHQMWKPLAPIALLGKNRATEALKPSPSKAIQINPRPLPSNKLRSKPNCSSVATTPDPVALSVAILDHDYCLSQKEPVDVSGEPGKRWNVKQQSAITIKTIEPLNSPINRSPQTIPAPTLQTLTLASSVILNQAPVGTQPMNVRKERPSSVLETPEASPTRLEEQADPIERCPKRERSYRGYNTTCSPRQSSEPRERKRGRERKKRFPCSSSPGSTGSESDSQSSSRSRSRSPTRKRYRPRRPDSNSSASSCSSFSSSPSRSRSPIRQRRYSYSSSRSGSWSTSHSRSPCRRVWRRSSRGRSPSLRPGYRPVSKENSEEIRRQKEKAIEERRVVYVGRIRGTMTRKELKDRFSLYGEIEECTLHFRDHGDNYGFVTYYDTKDAFMAIENGGKLRKPDELPFDLCFGGRRQFCKTSYADLDSNRDYDPSPTKGKFDALDFDTLLKQAQKSLRR
ncbi:hypothetical protein UPYG_G00320730 [Umbra pygmaea]|uniref:RRM domain-containing protein n=1 Tax=Umbra pygmaea TaxID=75934 RepID=A0ABD0WHQ4_UMBPY